MAQSMSYPGTIDGAVPISTIANRANSGLPLQTFTTNNSNNKFRYSRKMANEEQDEATSLYISFVMSMVMAQTRCTTAHSPSRCLFLSDGGDNNNSNIVSFDFLLTIAGKNLENALERSIHSTTCFCRLHARLVYVWIELSLGLNPTASNPIRFNF